jgi:hypothetical protein
VVCGACRSLVASQVLVAAEAEEAAVTEQQRANSATSGDNAVAAALGIDGYTREQLLALVRRVDECSLARTFFLAGV